MPLAGKFNGKLAVGMNNTSPATARNVPFSKDKVNPYKTLIHNGFTGNRRSVKTACLRP